MGSRGVARAAVEEELKYDISGPVRAGAPRVRSHCGKLDPRPRDVGRFRPTAAGASSSPGRPQGRSQGGPQGSPQAATGPAGTTRAADAPAAGPGFGRADAGGLFAVDEILRQGPEPGGR